MTRWQGWTLGGFALLWTLGSLGCASELPEPDPSSRRVLAQGEVVGFAAPEAAAHVWRGIPYAEPPVGPLRWRAPRPPQPWVGTREALDFGSPCVQFDVRSGDAIGDEDCLVLDVYAPKRRPEQLGKPRPWPVMLWIHGGGNTMGDSRLYDASRLASEGEVVVVSIQYRLGVLGWNAEPALRASAGDPKDASGNFGTLDTIRALEWVQQNAARFGGDPANVTIFGESAGGFNVQALLLSPLAKGLFHRAISQSGGLRPMTLAAAENYVDAVPAGSPGSSNEFLVGHLVRDGRAADRVAGKQVAAAMSPEEVEAYLRNKPAHELLQVFETMDMGGMYPAVQILRDGHVIPDMDPYEALATPGKHNAVPTILGSNRDETRLFSLFSSPFVRTWARLPMGFEDQNSFELSGTYGGRLWKALGVDEPAMAIARGGREDIYTYRFDWDEAGKLLWMDLAALLGASHGLEIPFVFGMTQPNFFSRSFFPDREAAEALSKAIRSYWVSFAYNGEPGQGVRGELPAWEAFAADAQAPGFMVLDTPGGGGLRMEVGADEAPTVVRELAEERRFTNAAARCQTFVDFGRFFREAVAPVYAPMAESECAAYPLPPVQPLRM